MARLRRILLIPSALMLVAVALSACSPSAPRLTDPNEILDQALTNVAATKTVHVSATASGEVNGSLLAALAPMLGGDLGNLGSLGGLTGGTIKIDGTQLQGDVDVAKQAFHASVNVPAAFLLTADVIGVDGTIYLKSTFGGSKYTKIPGSSLGVPGAGASASPDLAGLSADLKKAVADAGIKPQLKGVEAVGGKDAYHLTFPIPDASTTPAASAIPSLGSGTVDLWVYVDGVRPAKVEVNSASPQTGTIKLTVTLSDYDKGVSITAPAASEIEG